MYKCTKHFATYRFDTNVPTIMNAVIQRILFGIDINEIFLPLISLVPLVNDQVKYFDKNGTSRFMWGTTNLDATT